MGKHLETGRRVGQVETYIRKISNVPSARIRQEDALNEPFVHQNLQPSLVAEVPVELPDGTQTSIGIYNVISPYTEGGLAVMILDNQGKYHATPSEVPTAEMQAMFQVAGTMYSYMEQMAGMDVISLGYNNAPLNWGQEEEKGGGLQSIPTIFHLQYWNRRANLPMLPLSETKPHIQEYITGDSLNRFAATLAESILKNISTNFTDLTRISVSNQGLETELTTDLKSALANPEFAKFLKEFHTQLESAMAAVWDALTTSSQTEFPYEYLKEVAREAFEEGRPGALEILRQPPTLRPSAERAQRIAALPKETFPQAWIQKLLRLSLYMKNQDEVEVVNWVRKGFGFAMVMTQEKTAPRAKFILHPGVKITTSRGGVVEAQNISLKRIESGGNSVEEVQNNLKHIEELRQYLPTQTIRMRPGLD